MIACAAISAFVSNTATAVNDDAYWFSCYIAMLLMREKKDLDKDNLISRKGILILV